MGFRNLVITQPIKLAVKHEQLIIGDYTVPVEDINTVVIENSMITLSASLINKLSNYGVACYICDEKHNPSAVLLPIGMHSRHFQMLNDQIDMPVVLKKNLWKEIVKQKIYNQSLCLKELNKYGEQII